MREKEATVHEIEGQLVLVDPQAEAYARAFGQYKCRATFKLNQDRIDYFSERSKNYPPGKVVIVILNMDDPIGAVLGDALMPGHDWAAIREQGQVPFARGLAGRSGVVDFMAAYDAESVVALESMDHAPVTGPFFVPVVVIDYGVITVFPANFRE